MMMTNDYPEYDKEDAPGYSAMEPEWISVEDGLPREYESVDVRLNGTQIEKGWLSSIGWYVTLEHMLPDKTQIELFTQFEWRYREATP